MGWTVKAKMVLGVDGGESGGDGFEEEMATGVKDMISIPCPDMALSNKSLGKSGTELVREVRGGAVVGVYVGVG